MDPDFNPQLARKEEERLNTFSANGMFWLLIILVLILLALAVTILGSRENLSSAANSISPSPSEAYIPRIYTVSYKNGVFSPTNLRIHAGDTVRFRNDSLFPIRIVGDDDQVPGFDSISDVPQGSSFGVTFAAKGIFGYHNGKNADETGTIMVR